MIRVTTENEVRGFATEEAALAWIRTLSDGRYKVETVPDAELPQGMSFISLLVPGMVLPEPRASATPPMVDDARAQLREDVAVMRELGVVEWSRAGSTIRLGPAPAEQTADSTQQSFTAEERERRERQNVRRVVHASSGGPVKRLDGDLK